MWTLPVPTTAGREGGWVSGVAACSVSTMARAAENASSLLGRSIRSTYGLTASRYSCMHKSLYGSRARGQRPGYGSSCATRMHVAVATMVPLGNDGHVPLYGAVRVVLPVQLTVQLTRWTVVEVSTVGVGVFPWYGRDNGTVWRLAADVTQGLQFPVPVGPNSTGGGAGPYAWATSGSATSRRWCSRAVANW